MLSASAGSGSVSGLGLGGRGGLVRRLGGGRSGAVSVAGCRSRQCGRRGGPRAPAPGVRPGDAPRPAAPRCEPRPRPCGWATAGAAAPPPRRDAMWRPSSTASATTRHISVPARIASSFPGITNWMRSGIAVRVDDGDDRDAELVRLGDADVLLLGVEDEHRLGQLRHVADALQVALELLELTPDDERLLLRHGLEVAGRRACAGIPASSARAWRWSRSW